MTKKHGYRCFECNALASHAHHVVPFSLGGTRTIPLCTGCHNLVHGRSIPLSHSSLVKAGIMRRRIAGKPIVLKKTRNEAGILEALRLGLSVTKVCETLGVSRGAVCRTKAAIQ